MQEEYNNIDNKQLKSPEILISIGNVKLLALIDTGSVINGLSETWFNENYNKIGNYETLSVTNTVIVSAVGKRS